MCSACGREHQGHQPLPGLCLSAPSAVRLLHDDTSMYKMLNKIMRVFAGLS
jgi:hypothetical protein